MDPYERLTTADIDRDSSTATDRTAATTEPHQVTDSPDGTTVDQLTKQLEEAESTNSNGSSEHRGTGLHHVHLPKLQGADVIVYDSDQQTVRRGQHLEDVRSLLRPIEEHCAGISKPTV
ncbi:DUF7344 domain-containing protein [Halobellus rarus]|uniref:DUF7344 domain-containing protein n=1 Tax=Halobellus rarus TaxID=1126237 RepID=UPI003CE56B74